MFAQGNLTGFWWTGRPNFGDLLTPLLLDRFGDVQVSWAPAEKANVVCVGSIIEHLLRNWHGIVAGAGKMHERTEVLLPRAMILGVCGPLSARGLPGDIALGDPGLLADELVSLSVNKKFNLGLVPHWSDHKLEHRFGQYSPQIIRPSDDSLHVLHEISCCRKIIASSLHGIIIADAFGIPRRIEMTPVFARLGGDFKFREHNAAVGVPHQIGLTQEAPHFRVQDCKHQLQDMLVETGQHLKGERTLWF